MPRTEGGSDSPGEHPGHVSPERPAWGLPERKPPEDEPPKGLPPERKRQGEAGVSTREREETKKPDRWKVVLYNDNYTTMEFVVEVLIQVFKKDPTAATQIMLKIHNGGKGIAGVYIQEIAETKVATVHRLAERRGFPLRAGLERE